MNPALIDFTQCAHHQGLHAWREIQIDLAKHKLADVPPVSERLNQQLALTIYAWDQYSDDRFDRYDFCPGQDAVSYCLDVQGIWEPCETMAVLDILDGWHGRGLVVDVGSHIGYYAAIAAQAQCDVIAVEAFEESAILTNTNAVANRRGQAWNEERVGLIQLLKPEPARETRLFIADVEGQEAAAVEWYAAPFAAGLVHYALLEFSPVFNDTYPELLERLNGWGYEGWVIPHKGSSGLVEYAEEPTANLLMRPPLNADRLDFQQENVLFHYTGR